jgi:hypothetical protein
VIFAQEGCGGGSLRSECGHEEENLERPAAKVPRECLAPHGLVALAMHHVAGPRG